MGWMQKLCEAYDHVMENQSSNDAAQLSLIGMTEKNVEFNVTITKNGEFSRADRISKDEQRARVPSTPQAEARTTKYGAPYPLVEQCKYLCPRDPENNVGLQSYLEQLKTWAQQPGAPESLNILLGYLEKKTLYQDMAAFGIAPAIEADGSGADAKCFIGFSVLDGEAEDRLWRRPAVIDSWVRQAMTSEGEAELCYVTGERLPIMEKHPKVQGNAKLISSKDGEFRFSYKGRFTEDGEAARVSRLASAKAHNALKYLVDLQGLRLQQFGMTTVAWHVNGASLAVAATAAFPSGNEGFEDESEDEFEDVEEEQERHVDVFNTYALAIRDVTKRHGELLKQSDGQEATQKRREYVCIMSTEAATPGRLSITYYQEMPGNQYVERLKNWYSTFFWIRPRKGSPVQSPSIFDICEAVYGRGQLIAAKKDHDCKKSGTKAMRELSLRIIKCIAEGAAFPQNYVETAFQRAVSPMSFVDGKGKWAKQAWRESVATTCALIQKQYVDQAMMTVDLQGDGRAPYLLDRTRTDRSYLYGRLLAVANRIEQLARSRDENKDMPTHALRMMPQMVRKPRATWLHLHEKMIPMLRRLESRQQIGDYQRLIGAIEAKFDRAARSDASALSEQFLLGYDAQSRALWGESIFAESSGKYALPLSRDERYGCLLALADFAEQMANGERTGQTNAIELANKLNRQPSIVWIHIHDRLLPYFGTMSVAEVKRIQRLIAKVECQFSREERTQNAPLNDEVLHGYYCMRTALLSDALDAAWDTVKPETWQPDTREAVFAALFAEEDRTERIVLDVVKQLDEEHNRLSNVLRMFQRAERSPRETWNYLQRRVEPYLKKLWASGKIDDRLKTLMGVLKQNGWDTDEPLSPVVLHEYYCYTMRNEEE